jgi:hypothetical protein
MPLHIFSWCDEVLLYFIVRVEVIEIQIWFEFKLICNLQYSFEKKKKNFLVGNWLRAEFGAAQPAGAVAQRIHGRAPRSRSKSDLIAPNPTR